MTTRQIHRFLAAPAILASVCVLAACSSPPPTAEIRGARDAIARAQDNGADHLAPQQLQSAQDKLGRAETAVNAKEMKTAEYLAEEATVDANLASATSNEQRVSAAASQLQGLEKKTGR